VVRERIAQLLGVLAETVVGAPVMRAYGIEARTQDRLDTAHRGPPPGRDARRPAVGVLLLERRGVRRDRHRRVVVIGAWLGLGGTVTPGTVSPSSS
jgi:ATP-binding cassette, subfamily B, bacterial